MIPRLALLLAFTLTVACDQDDDDPEAAAEDSGSGTAGEPVSACSQVYECLAADCLDEYDLVDSDYCASDCEPGPVPCSPGPDAEEKKMVCDERRHAYIECQTPCYAMLTGDDATDWGPYTTGGVARETFETCASGSPLECDDAKAQCAEWGAQ